MDISLKRLKNEQEVDHRVDIEFQMEERCTIASKDDVTSTSEGSDASTLTVDTRQEKSGKEELPNEMRIREKSSYDHEDDLKVTSYLYNTSCCFIVYGESFFYDMIKCYRIWSLLLLVVMEQKQAR